MDGFEFDRAWSISAATATTTAVTRPETNKCEKERSVATMETGTPTPAPTPATPEKERDVSTIETGSSPPPAPTPGTPARPKPARLGIAWGACHFVDLVQCKPLPTNKLER